MRAHVRRNFDQVYASEQDPWNIGDAVSDRYDAYVAMIESQLSEIAGNGSELRILDIGAGFGAFLNRLSGPGRRLTALELSKTAVEKGRARYPHIQFIQADTSRLAELSWQERFHLIICSDVVYYLPERSRIALMHAIYDLLDDHGLFFLASWCPGGRYLTPEEHSALASVCFKQVQARSLSSQHQALILQKRHKNVVISVDYETWQPLPPGKQIDWDTDIFLPAEKLMRTAEEVGAPISFMVEMGEYLWLRQNEPVIAEKMRAHLVSAVVRGHDLQLHLHPSWLPELGARRDGNGWYWDDSVAKANDYPGDLVNLIATCKRELEDIGREADNDFQIVAFRAGAYQVQPFDRLSEALAANEIFCDTSVYRGGVDHGRGYDFSLAFKSHQPYWASPSDPQLPAVPAEREIVELPIFSPTFGERWFLDSDAARLLASSLRKHVMQEEAARTSRNLRQAISRRNLIGKFYGRSRRHLPVLNSLWPRSLTYDLAKPLVNARQTDDYYVMIGHTKSDLDFDAIRQGLLQLKAMAGVRFVTLRTAVESAIQDLRASDNYRSPLDEKTYQIERERSSILGTERNESQSVRLQEMIPLDRERILDLGCGAGYWSRRIAAKFPWSSVVGIDIGDEFLARATETTQSINVRFEKQDFESLSFPEGSFDCVYADNTIEHAFDVDRVLSEIHRVLTDGGVLVAAIPSDARNPDVLCDNHNWRTYPGEATLRLQRAGFVNIEITELDTYRTLGTPPYPPSRDMMMYIKAWKRDQPATQLLRATEAMDWVYRKLDPARPSHGNDPAAIIQGGYAFCWGYSVVLGRLLQREGFEVRWLTMLAKDHPRGRGENSVDSHEVLVVSCDGRDVILDPMSNTVIPHTLSEILADPSLARPPANPDERYTKRGYELYSTGFWYERVHKYALRRNPDKRIWRWTHRR